MKTIYVRTILFSFCLCVALVSNAQGLLTLQLTSFTAESRNGNVGLTWKSASEENLMQYEIEYSRDGRLYRNLGFIPARNSINGDFYEFEHPVSYSDSAFYRLKIVDNRGRWLYTPPVLYHVNKITAFFVNPSVIRTGVMNIFLSDPFDWLQVVNINGTVMLKENLSGKMGRINVPISADLAKGVYIVQLGDHYKTITQKVVIQ
ncbi:MAG: T9SS type A sorting domain-containing protein [Bacteroidetes bacterium]|nr:MAG: T9SS type A sorting domain-containing protein [Bacteroidota bacterium]